ncbi:MAG: nucleotidyltransferase [Deltaproteobacteria bacterium]|nr:nucleotidyltransferase [Deltaproteobacteria bacterium]
MNEPHVKLLKSLNDRGVEYLLVGGMLAIAYGVPRVTKDIDLFIRNDVDNAAKVLEVLDALGFGTAHLTTPEEVTKNEITVFKDFLRLDLLTKLKGIKFEEVFPRRAVIRLKDVDVPVLTLEDLIAEKKAAGRPGDLEDAAQLEKIQAMLRGNKPGA